MKKLILALVATLSLYAADNNLYNYSFSFVGGYALNSSESNLDNSKGWGFRYGYNRDTVENSIDPDVIQFTLDYNADVRYGDTEEGVDIETDIYRLGLNTLWYMENDSDATPYVAAGIGIQIFSENEAEKSNNTLFATIGAGIEYQLRGDFSALAEVKGVFAGDDSSYIIGNIGFKYSFGQNYQAKPASVQPRAASVQYISPTPQYRPVAR